MGVAHMRLRDWKDNWNGIAIILQYPAKVCILSDIQEIDFKNFLGIVSRQYTLVQILSSTIE